MQTPCDSCHAGCCRGKDLVVSPIDILRIETETTYRIEDFIDLQEAGDATQVPYEGFRLKEAANVPHFFVLKKVESRGFPGSRKCVFLQEERNADEGGGHPGERVRGHVVFMGVGP